MQTFEEGISIAPHFKDVSNAVAQEALLVFSIKEIPLDQKCIVVSPHHKSEQRLQGGERRIKVKRISASDIYISYRRKELVAGKTSEMDVTLKGVLSRDFNLALSKHNIDLGVRKAINFNSSSTEACPSNRTPGNKENNKNVITSSFQTPPRTKEGQMVALASAIPAAAPRRLKPRPSVSMGLLDLLPTPTRIALPPSSASSVESSSSGPSGAPLLLKNPLTATKSQPIKTMKQPPATQGLKDLFPSSTCASITSSSSSSLPSLPLQPFAYIPSAHIDPSSLALKATSVVADVIAPNSAPPPPPPPPPGVLTPGKRSSDNPLEGRRKKMRTLHWSIIPKVCHKL